MGRRLIDAAGGWKVVAYALTVLVLIGSMMVWRELTFTWGLAALVSGMVPVLPLFAVAQLMSILGDIERQREDQRHADRQAAKKAAGAAGS